jgi:ABC-type transport system substrate-binding protein
VRRAPFALAALALVAPGWAALGPRYGGDLTVAAVGPLPRLATATPDSAAGRLLTSLTQASLVGLGLDGLPVPALARSWTSAAGGREWILALDEEARFHDEVKVTAADAVRSLQTFLARASPSARALAARLAADGVAAPDSGHVVLRLREPFAAPLAPLAGAWITGLAGAEAGPFIPTYEAPGSRVALTAFASHVRGRPYFDRVAVVASADEEHLRAGLATRESDVALNAPGVSALAGTLLLVLDPRQPVLADREARAAIVSALDVDAIVKRFLPGGVATRSLLPLAVAPSSGPAAPSTRPVSGVLALAVSSEVPALVSQRVVAHLDALGLHVTVRVLDPAAARCSDAAGRLIVFVPEVPEPTLTLRELALLAPQVAGAEEALAEAEREASGQQRRAALEKAAAALLQDKTLVPLAAVPLSAGVRPGIEGVRIDAGGRVVLEDAWAVP